MPAFLSAYFSEYGYLTIFVFVMLLELGMPGLPNELMLLYIGYMSRKAGLSYPAVIILVIIADILGSFLLYALFYHGSTWLMRIKPKWLKLPEKKIAAMKNRIKPGNGRSILLGKLTPFVRSYIPVIAGLMQVSPALYGRIIILTAAIWSGGWLTIGWIFRIGF